MSLSSGFASKKQEILYTQLIFRALQTFQEALLQQEDTVPLQVGAASCRSRIDAVDAPGGSKTDL